MSLRAVSVAGTGSFLSGPPVSNDRLEAVLGTLDNASPKVIVDNHGRT